MGNDKKLDKKILNNFFFLLLFTFIYFGYLIFKPFWQIIAFSILTTVVSLPVHKIVKEKIKNESWAALSTTIVILLFLLIPAIFFIITIVNQLLEIVPMATKFVSETKDIDYHLQNAPYIGSAYIKIKSTLISSGINFNLSNIGKNYGGTVAKFVLDQGQNIITNVGMILVNVLFIIMTVFFLLRDGNTYYQTFYQIIPLPNRDKQFLVEKSSSAIKAIFLGTILTAFIQGILGFIAYITAGVSFSLFWGFATFVTSFLPLGGAAIIWAPIAIYLFIVKGSVWGIAMLIWGTVVISGSDNVVRPIIIGGQTNINTLVLVFAILGGLQVFGFIGIFITPVIVVLLDNLLLLYKEKYLNYNMFYTTPTGANGKQEDTF